MKKKQKDKGGIMFQPPILECPWCGSYPIHERRPVGGIGVEPVQLHWYACRTCNIAHPIGEATEAAALLKWNRRHNARGPVFIGENVVRHLSGDCHRRLVVMMAEFGIFVAALDMKDLDTLVRVRNRTPEEAIAHLDRVLRESDAKLEEAFKAKAKAEIIPLRQPPPPAQEPEKGA